MQDFDQFDVVVLPFPFTDKAKAGTRPALVLSSAVPFNNKIGQSIMAMVTTARHSRWPLDIEITDLGSAGLPVPSRVRFKLFTLDHRLVVRRCGKLGDNDRNKVQVALATLMNLLPPPA